MRLIYLSLYLKQFVKVLFHYRTSSPTIKPPGVGYLWEKNDKHDDFKNWYYQTSTCNYKQKAKRY